MNSIRNRQTGFTLIELIIVIIILGILAATAIPRFAQMQSEARISKLNALRGSVQTAAGLVNGLSLAKSLDATAQNLSVQGQAVAIINNFPTAANAGIMAAIGNYATVANQTADGISTTDGGPLAGDLLTIHVTGGPDDTACIFTYTNPATAGNSATVSTVTTTGC